MVQRITTDQSIPQFRWIRLLACLAAIGFNTLAAAEDYFQSSVTYAQAHSAQTAEHMLMWCVPCFLMVTGALLLDPSREIRAGKLFGKYIRRVALALVCFTLIFQCLDFLMGESRSILGGWLSNLFQDTGWPHMWYLYLMIGIYLMIPFYRIIAERASREQIWFLIAVLLLFVSVLPTCRVFGLESGFFLPTMLIYPAYVFAGYILYQRNMPVWTAALLAAAGTAAILYFSFSMADGGAQLTGYDSMAVAAQSMGFYSLLLRVKTADFAVLRNLDECVFGIYLIHFVGIKVFMKWIGFDPFMHGQTASFLGLLLFCFFGAYALTFLLRRIPGVNLL